MKLTPLDAPGLRKGCLCGGRGERIKVHHRCSQYKAGVRRQAVAACLLPDLEAAKIDALRLSKGMTYKNAAASLPPWGR